MTIVLKHRAAWRLSGQKQLRDAIPLSLLIIFHLKLRARNCCWHYNKTIGIRHTIAHMSRMRVNQIINETIQSFTYANSNRRAHTGHGGLTFRVQNHEKICRTFVAENGSNSLMPRLSQKSCSHSDIYKYNHFIVVSSGLAAIRQRIFAMCFRATHTNPLFKPTKSTSMKCFVFILKLVSEYK